jgi:membrane associated rhomboid family serine protease
MMSRSRELLRTTPPVTIGIIALCVALYLVPIDLQSVTLCPRLVLYLREYYRILSSALFHASLTHIGMNMMSVIAIGTLLEQRMGTILFLFTTLWSILLTGAIYLAIAQLLSLLFHKDSLMYQHSVGFSGVLFHMSVLECNLGPHRSRSLFGFLTVPSFLYPWALLGLLQVLVPGLSFTGHLAGILAGSFQSCGFLDGLLVSVSYTREMETWSSVVAWFTTTCPNNYCRAPTSETVLIIRGETAITTSVHDVRQFIWQGMCLVVQWIGHVLETLKVIVLGRAGREATTTMVTPWRWGTTYTFSSNFSTTTEVDDDEEDDWVGLPPDRPSQLV